MAERERLIIGISGASGVVYGIRLLEVLRPLPLEVHLVMTHPAELTLAYETNAKVADLHALADVVHPDSDVGASISSGSFQTKGMIIAPCSMRSVSAIATGVTSNLLTRAADVVLKEKRRLLVMVRETPLHAGHLRSLTALAELGAVVFPPVPAFYEKPGSLEEMVDQTVGRALDFFEIDVGLVQRWGEEAGKVRPVRVVKASGAET